MKTSISAHKLKLVEKAGAELPLLLIGFESGNLAQLGRLCECVCQLDEYLTGTPVPVIADKNRKLISYLRNRYRNRIVLLLSSIGRRFIYTMHDINRFVRGESIHGASDIRDDKRKTLHDYVFEHDPAIDWEFIVCWNWIAGPNIRSSSGHDDSGGPLVHSINLNGRTQEVSLIESVILCGNYELWQAATAHPQAETTKHRVQFNPYDFESLWGGDISRKIADQISEYQRRP
jgi:hypothetical protein